MNCNWTGDEPYVTRAQRTDLVGVVEVEHCSEDRAVGGQDQLVGLHHPAAPAHQATAPQSHTVANGNGNIIRCKILFTMVSILYYILSTSGRKALQPAGFAGKASFAGASHSSAVTWCLDSS